MKPSFLAYLRTGQMTPFSFGALRPDLIKLFSEPDSWVSRDDPLFSSRNRDYLSSDSISFGGLTLSFDSSDPVEAIMIRIGDAQRLPTDIAFFPSDGASIHDLISLMERHDVSYRHVSADGDQSLLSTAGGVQIFGRSRSGRNIIQLSSRNESPSQDA